MAYPPSVLKIVFAIAFLVHAINSTKIKRDVKVIEYSCKDKECPEGYNILHVKATEYSKNNTVHYLWSTIGLPTILVGMNDNPKTKLDVRWGNGSPDSIEMKFVPEVVGISAFAITDITEYSDGGDNQYPFGKMLRNVLQNFTWNLLSCKNLSDGAIGNFQGSSKDFNQSSISFDLRAFAEDGYDDLLPHLKVSANSSSFNVVYKNLPTLSKISRYSIGLAIVKDSSTGMPSYKTTESIDDEHTPGTFRLRELNIPTKGGHQTFASWKPVAYNKPERKFSSQTFLHNFPSNNKGNLKKHHGSIGYSIINSLVQKRDIFITRVSFGQHKDGYYAKTGFMSWTGLVGYGTTPESEFSKKVVLILSLGLGLPVALCVFGSLGLVIKKLTCKKKIVYEQIN